VIETLTHECPIKGCEVRVVNSKLMCSRHWGHVSSKVAIEVYRSFRESRGSHRHMLAMEAAIAEVENRRKSL
jgi:hypothetical protein